MKRLQIVALACLIMAAFTAWGGCSGQQAAKLRAQEEAGVREPWDKTDWMFFSGMAACQMADGATTFAILEQGGHELNPMLPDNGPAIFGIKAALTGLIGGVGYVVPTHKMRRTLFTITGAFGCAAAGWNGHELATH